MLRLILRPLVRVAVAAAAAWAPPGPATAGEVAAWLRRTVAAPLQAAHRQPPPHATDPCVADLAARIAWLEHHLDASGSIVAQQPDVWGQSRLTRHRVDYEQQMQRQLGAFTERTSAAIRRSDQAFTGLALAMQSASGRRRLTTEVAVPEVTTSNSVVTSIQGLLPTTNEAVGRTDPVVIARTAPFAAVPNPAALQFDDQTLALEPTVHLDQLSRYLNHLNQLRRINEGDDSADAPGYALNLVRIPVSILPGKRTEQGYGAEITVTAAALLGDDLLPVTFRSLVINDLVDMIAPALTWCVNDPECVAWAATITGAAPAAAAPAEARAAFADYVRCRWPIRVFALDPVSEEQNVDDAYARRRELQIAMATAAATGRLNAQAMARFTRRLEQDMAVIALNKTAVGFSHGSDTFGWRFYPRVQTPPARGGLATLGETICGPTSGADLARRRLEPGQRECTALVVMPAFVPCVTLDVRTKWFSLAHPGTTEPDVRQAVAMERAVETLHASVAACGRGGCHDGEAARLLRIADQLRHRLPLQSLQAMIPQENTAGGFELFNAGITDLAPELLGWYGAPGIDPAGSTMLFLVGKGFSVLDTRVIAGGRPARFRALSRDLIEVEVPAGAVPIMPAACPAEAAAAHRQSALLLASAAEPLPPPGMPAAPRAGCGSATDCGLDCSRREFVNIHLATPYGVSGHLLVPVVQRAGGGGGRPVFEPTCTIGLTFGVTKTASVPAAKVDEFFTASCDAITIPVPESFIPPAKATLRLLVRDAATGATAAAFSFPDPFFDARRGRYVIAGGDLRNFVGDTSRPASDKTLRGAVKPYLDSLLQQGGLDADGDAVALTATAAIVAGEHEVPVGGALAVTATRRGKATPEAPPEPAVIAP